MYIDPLKRRAEWEGMVAFVNKKRSVIFSNLVAKADKFVQFLPWGSDFEHDVFTRPDYTSLDVMTFAGSGTPLGINIPNFDDIRENIGFKNVYLGNVMPAPKAGEVKFLGEVEKELLTEHFSDIMLVKVALHELLGHGTGKEFK